MRIIKAFLTSIILLILVGGGLFLIAREGLLWMTTSRVKQSLNQVRDIDQRQSYATECGSKGSDRDERGRVHSTQLRFTDENSYVVEVICNQMEYLPIEVVTEDLPPFTTRQVGKSGVRWGQELGINFTTLGRVASVMVVDEQVITSRKLASVDGDAGPPSNCSAYRFSCCDVNMQLGQGKFVSEVLDCPQGCFESCEDRPIILSFSTQPYYNKIDRTLQISKNQAVVFSFVVSPSLDSSFTGYLDSDDPVEKFLSSIETIFAKNPEEEQVTVHLDLGDGKKESFSGLRGQIEHKYNCAGTGCTYEAKIMVVKQGGIESYDGPQNKVIVQVN